MEPSSRLEIDLVAIASNARALRSRLPAGCALAGVVKANAYGLGLEPVARALVSGGTSMLAVYDAREAAVLIDSENETPVLLLGPLLDELADPVFVSGARRGQLEITVASPRQLEIAGRLARAADRAVPVHVEVDTGMARAGCEPREAARLVASTLADPRLRLAGVSTHMADAEDPSAVRAQAAVFRAVLDGLPPLPTSCRRHLANTRSVLRHPSLAADMVRCGQGWVGFGADGIDDPLALRRVVRWTSRIVHVRRIEAGQGVGYGRRWRAGGPTRIGLVPVGYADGLPRTLLGTTDEPRMQVGLGSGPDGRPVAWAPVVGAVSMDQITIDLSGIPGDIDATPGAAVEIVGRDESAPNDLGRLATAAGTTHYELLCRLGPRVARERSSAAISPAIG